jgi:hypothetical protein
LLLPAPEKGVAQPILIGTALRPRRYRYEHATLAAKEPGDSPRVNHNESLRIMLVGLIRVKDIGADHERLRLFRHEKGGFQLGERERFQD